MSKLSLQMKRNIFQYRMGTLLNQKHAVRFKKSTSLQCPLCLQADSVLHILSGCQHTTILGMITVRHNVACRLIMKAISKGSLKPVKQIILPNKTFKFQSILMMRHYRAGSFMLIDLPEIDSPLVALMSFWSLPYLLQIQIDNHSSCAQGVLPETTQWRCMQSS